MHDPQPSSSDLLIQSSPHRDRRRARRLPEPPDRLPQFPIAGLMLLTGAIAVDLGMLRACTPYAPGGAVLICFGLTLMQLNDRFSESASLAAQLWAGIVLPATLMTVMLMDPHVPDGGSLAIPLGVFWVGPFFLWSICRYFDLPRTAALLAGCLAMTGIYGFMAAFSFSFFGASGNHAALGKESWSTLGAVTAITGIIVAGLVAGVVHFRAMRRGWRRSYRNGLALLLAIGGPILLMIASHVFAIALIQSAKSAAAQATSGS